VGADGQSVWIRAAEVGAKGVCIFVQPRGYVSWVSSWHGVFSGVLGFIHDDVGYCNAFPIKFNSLDNYILTIAMSKGIVVGYYVHLIDVESGDT
jgi:hypothetical protein